MIYRDVESVGQVSTMLQAQVATLREKEQQFALYSLSSLSVSKDKTITDWTQKAKDTSSQLETSEKEKMQLAAETQGLREKQQAAQE